MCRSVLLDFEEEREIHGVKTFKFSGGDRTVDNGTLYPENECYCSGDCVPSGLFNVSSCRFGTPVFMSFPHFYKADPFYHKQVDGMKPDKNKHEFSMSFEPVRLLSNQEWCNLYWYFVSPQKTSFPLEIAARFQLNLLVTPIPRINLYKNVPRKFMPILWFEQHIVATKTVSNVVKLILAAPTAGQILGVIFAIIGITLTFLSCFRKRVVFAPQMSNKSKTESQKINLPENLPLMKQ